MPSTAATADLRRTVCPVPAPSRLLTASFTCFNSLRVVAYLPSLAAIVSTGQTESHSLFTWLVFLGSNASMALWLYERNGRHLDRAICINAVNAVMCAAIAACIATYRLLAFLAGTP